MLAAAAVVAVVATGVVLSGNDPDEGGSDRVAQPGPLPTEWRTEYWHDMVVDVPADWGYGGAPMESGGDTVACYATAMVTADGERLKRDDPTMGYVGRPIALTDVCQKYPFTGPDADPPDAPYVWLGSLADLGTEDLGDGWTQQTIEVNGSRLTVATDDTPLRKRILASAAGGETCMSAVETQAESDVFPSLLPDGNLDDVESMTVCAYRAEEGEDVTAGQTANLTYATTVDKDAAREYLEAMARGEPGRDLCPTANYDQFEWVALELNDADGRTIRRDVVHLACVAGVDVHAETLRGVEPGQTDPGHAPPVGGRRDPRGRLRADRWQGRMLDSFIGPQGVSQRSSWLFTKTSRVSIRIAAAVGIASSAPTTPSSAAPTSAAITVTAPGMSTDLDITRG